MDGIDFKFYLNFKNDNTGVVEITEVVKFDGASFTLEQDKGRYGRDISFGNEEVNLVFYEGLYDRTLNPLQLPDATIVYNLAMGLPFLLDYYRTFGFESEVEFIIEKDGVTFTVGVLDFQLAKTDLLTYFETKIIQETKRAIINRRKDTKVDVFSDKDLDLNPITPLTTTNILLKAKPVKQVSQWDSTGANMIVNAAEFSGGAAPVWFNKVKNTVKYGIDNTLSWLEDYTQPSYTDFDTVRNDFKVIGAREDLTNIKVKIKLKLRLQEWDRNSSFDNSVFVFRGHLVKGLGDFEDNWSGFASPDTDDSITFMTKILGDDNGVYLIDVDEEINIDLGNLQRDGKMWFVFTFNGTTQYTYYKIDFLTTSLEVSVTSTAIDSVIKGIRYIDLFKQSVLSTSGMTVNAPRFDVGGEHYNQFAFNGYGLRQFTGKPFYVTVKDLMEGLQEVNGDYQINPTNVFIGEYPDFYPAKDLGGFLQAPDDEFSSNFNERYTLSNLEYKYESYEQNKDESNTIDGVHTELQKLMPNRLVESIKKISVNHRRDPFAIEADRKQAISIKDTTSLNSDDKLSVIDVVELAPGTKGGFSANLSQRIDPTTGMLQILNSNGTDTGTFDWTLLGFNQGDNFRILSGNNIGHYVVHILTPTVITISGGGGTFTEISIITVDYPLTNVQYVNRTNQGFTLIQNLESGDNFSNLRYTIRRNLIHWESYMATACKYKPNGIISNTYFKNNGELITQFMGGTTYQENEPINVSDLVPAILAPLIYKTRVVATFEMMVLLLNALNTINADGSIGGLIRIADTNNRVLKLHPTVLDYEWATQLLTITGEQRNESDYVTVNTIGLSLVEIDEVGYPTAILSNEWFKITGNYVCLYDANSIPLINPTRIDKIKVNGVLYSSGTALAIALSDL